MPEWYLCEVAVSISWSPHDIFVRSNSSLGWLWPWDSRWILDHEWLNFRSNFIMGTTSCAGVVMPVGRNFENTAGMVLQGNFIAQGIFRHCLSLSHVTWQWCHSWAGLNLDFALFKRPYLMKNTEDFSCRPIYVATNDDYLVTLLTLDLDPYLIAPNPPVEF